MSYNPDDENREEFNDFTNENEDENSEKSEKNYSGSSWVSFLVLFLILIAVDVFMLSTAVFKDSLNCNKENGCTYIQHKILTKNNEFKFNRDNILKFYSKREMQFELYRHRRLYRERKYKEIYNVVLYKYGNIEIPQGINYKLQLFKEGYVKEIQYQSFRADKIIYAVLLFFATLIIFKIFWTKLREPKDGYIISDENNGIK